MVQFLETFFALFPEYAKNDVSEKGMRYLDLAVDAL